MDDPIERLIPEMRRGVMQLAILSMLREESYGYALCRRLGEEGFPIEEGTLYPILRRFEEQGIVQSSWDTKGPRPRKYYSLTRRGGQLLDGMREQWDGIAGALGKILRSENARRS